MILLFANNARSFLAAPISATDTTATLALSTGALFPVITSPSEGFLVTFNDRTTGLLTEICLVTDISGDTITMVRGQEGTTAQDWAANDYCSNFYTAGTAQSFMQVAEYQSGFYTYAIAGGTANNITATLNSAFNYAPDGMCFILSSAYANTGATQLTMTLGGTIQAARPIVKNGNIPIVAGDIPSANYPMQLVYNATWMAYVLTNPATSSGTVTSIDVSGGTTGLTFSGGPITTSGVITAGGVLNVASGGTGTTTATGTGSIVRSNSPTLVAPNLGTPSFINLDNAVNLPTSAITGILGVENGGTGTDYGVDGGTY